MPNTYRPYRILSIDGGGLKGIIALAVLGRLDAAVPRWRESISMFAGNSTGALIALGLSKGMTPTELLDIYMTKGPRIFERSLWRAVRNVGRIIGPKYASANRLALCQDIFGTTLKLGELDHHVVITSLDLDDRLQSDQSKKRWKAKIFHNLPTNDDSGDDEECVFSVAMRTSAAPTYFASFDGFVDGGVFANNPAMCALAQTQDRRLTEGIPFEQIKMFSVGTGFFPYFRRNEDWGLAQWAPHLVDLLMDGVNEVADFQVRVMLPAESYFRLSPRLASDIAMDDAHLVGALLQIGNGVPLDNASKFVASW